MISHGRTDEASERASRSNPASAFVARASDVAGDFVELAELQVRLAKSDAKELVRRSVPALMTVVAAAIVGISSLPILLLGMASFLSEAAAFPLWQSQLLIGAVAFIIATLLLVMGTGRLKKCLNTFDTSATEFGKNVEWLKQVIRGQ